MSRVRHTLLMTSLPRFMMSNAQDKEACDSLSISMAKARGRNENSQFPVNIGQPQYRQANVWRLIMKSMVSPIRSRLLRNYLVLLHSKSHLLLSSINCIGSIHIMPNTFETFVLGCVLISTFYDYHCSCGRSRKVDTDTSTKAARTVLGMKALKFMESFGLLFVGGCKSLSLCVRSIADTAESLAETPTTLTNPSKVAFPTRSSRSFMNA